MIKMARLAGTVSNEYSWYMESSQRNEDGADPLNPTNNISVNMNTMFNQLPALQLNLASIELPLAQYTIESAWNRLYFTEGLRLIANDLSDATIREFVVQVNGINYTVTLPLYLNPIVAVNVSTPADPIFTTQFEHGLELADLWSWSPVQLISTPLGVPNNNLSDNPALTILSPTEFQLTGVGGAYVAPSGVFGYVFAPAIPSPTNLATLITEGLLAQSLDMTVTYDTATGFFTITEKTSPNDIMYVVTLSKNSLSVIMGFSSGTGMVPLVSQTYPRSSCVTVRAVGGYGYQCYSRIEIPIGSYSAEGLRQQMAFEWNRFYFEVAGTFVFANQIGDILSITIPVGLYTPHTLAAFIEAEMNNGLGPLSTTYTVVYDEANGQFCFSNTNLTAFSLEFNATPADTVHPRLGFQTTCYRGSTTYCSTETVYVPSVSCCGGVANVNCENATRYTSYIYEPTINVHKSTFCIHVCNIPSIADAAAIVINSPGAGYATITTTVAHGYQCEDVVIIYVAPASFFTLRVTEVVTAFMFVVDMASVVGLADGAVGVSPASNVTSNLFFNSSLQNGIAPRMLGFPMVDQLSPPPFCAPFAHDVAGPNHVLLVLAEPKGTTHNNHTFGTSNLQNVLAKIILYPQLRMERILSYTMYLPALEKLTKLGFSLLNPDHTPYQLHGKEWSCSVTFVAAIDTSAQLLSR